MGSSREEGMLALLKKQSDALAKLIDQAKELQRALAERVAEARRAGTPARKIERRKAPR